MKSVQVWRNISSRLTNKERERVKQGKETEGKRRNGGRKEKKRKRCREKQRKKRGASLFGYASFPALKIIIAKLIINLATEDRSGSG